MNEQPKIVFSGEKTYILNTTRQSPADVWQVPVERASAFLKNPDLQRLSASQKTFFLQCQSENYKPSKQEVLDAKKREMPAISTLSLDDYKATKLQELDILSLDTAGLLSPAYQRQNAEVSTALLSIDPTAETVYTAEKSREILANANRIGILCRDERYRIAELIQNATSNEDVDRAFNANKYATFQ